MTSAQAATAGMSRNAIRARVRTGRWQLMQRGVYATFSGEPSRIAVLWAAVLYAGTGAMLSHQTAAELANLTETRSEFVHVTVPAERRVSRAPGIVIHLSGRASATLHPARLPPQTRIEETVLDLVDRAGSLDDAVGG
jgi:predicted transcriptional regulator of viral defense system